MTCFARRSLLLLSVLALACGARSSGLEGGDGDGDGDGDGSGDGDAVCEGFEDEPGSLGETIVKATNGGQETLYLGGLWSCDFGLMSVVPADATNDTHWPQRKCEPRCADILGDGGGWGCDDSCPIAAVIKVEPGGFYPTVWSGEMYVPREPPAECCFEGDCYGPCYTVQPADQSTYRATVNVFTEVSCLDDPACDCAPNAEGWCQLEGFAEAFPEQGNSMSVDFEAPTDEVVLHIWNP